MSALPVQGIFDALHDAGLSVSLASGGGLVVSPGSRLTPDLRELVKGNKAALLGYLLGANDPTSSKPYGLELLTKPNIFLAANNPTQAVGLVANSVVAKLVFGQTPVSSDAVSTPAFTEPPSSPIYSDGWLVLAQAYYTHHFKCPVCIAAGRGTGYGFRCGTGAALWAPYDQVSKSKTS